MSDTSSQKHRIFQERLYLEPDGELTHAEADALESHLKECASCREERRDVAALGYLLRSGAVEADAELARQVMANLPSAGWEARNPRAWRPAAAVFALLALAATLAAVLGGGEAPAAAPLLGTARAVSDLLLTTAVAGAGLLTASWQGLGLALGEVFGGSKTTMVAFAIFVVGIDFLFVRHLLSHPRKALAAARRDRSE